MKSVTSLHAGVKAHVLRGDRLPPRYVSGFNWFADFVFFVCCLLCDVLLQVIILCVFSPSLCVLACLCIYVCVCVYNPRPFNSTTWNPSHIQVAMVTRATYHRGSRQIKQVCLLTMSLLDDCCYEPLLHVPHRCLWPPVKSSGSVKTLS